MEQTEYSEATKKILIVDDVAINREILGTLLEDEYEILEAVDGEDAFKKIIANYSSLSLILLDLMMPGVDGFQVLELLRANNYTAVPVIIITANSELEYEKRGLLLGAVDFIPKPFDPDIVKYRVDAHVKLKNYQDHLESLVEKSVAKMAATWTHMIQALAEVIECRNQESGQHVKRVTRIVQLIIEAMNKKKMLEYYFPPKAARYVAESSALHDIGKIGIPDAILMKPGKLTDEEYVIMKTHATIGYEMADKFTEFCDDDYRKYSLEITLGHHEKWDGTGYPNGRAGRAIPLSARITAIADTYDAITNDRVYRKGQTHEAALAILKDQRGKQFDPWLIDLFVENEKTIATLANKDLIYN
ncbi:two-component system response regulator [Clostridia bacterium]|nr:two-component system response regulator [Clostridia bacterium]